MDDLFFLPNKGANEQQDTKGSTLTSNASVLRVHVSYKVGDR